MSKLAPFRGKTTPRNQPMQTGRITHQNPTKGRRLSTKRNDPQSCQKKDEINVKKGRKQGQKKSAKSVTDRADWKAHPGHHFFGRLPTTENPFSMANFEF